MENDRRMEVDDGKRYLPLFGRSDARLSKETGSVKSFIGNEITLDDMLRKFGVLPPLKPNEKVLPLNAGLFAKMDIKTQELAIAKMLKHLKANVEMTRDMKRKIDVITGKKVKWTILNELFTVWNDSYVALRIAVQVVKIPVEGKEIIQPPVMVEFEEVGKQIAVAESIFKEPVQIRIDQEESRREKIRCAVKNAREHNKFIDMKWYVETCPGLKKCDFCQFSGTYHVCTDCASFIKQVESMPGFDPRNVKSRVSYVRKWIRLNRNVEEFTEWFAKKKPYTRYFVPSVKPQDFRDFDQARLTDIEDLAKELSRQQRRMADYNLAHKQGGDLAEIAMTWIKNVIDFLKSSHAVVAVASIVLAVACTALFTWLLTVKVKSDVAWWVKNLTILGTFVGLLAFGSLAAAMFNDALKLFKLKPLLDADEVKDLNTFKSERAALKVGKSVIAEGAQYAKKKEEERLLGLLTEEEKKDKTVGEQLLAAKKKDDMKILRTMMNRRKRAGPKPLPKDIYNRLRAEEKLKEELKTTADNMKIIQEKLGSLREQMEETDLMMKSADVVEVPKIVFDKDEDFLYSVGAVEEFPELCESDDEEHSRDDIDQTSSSRANVYGFSLDETAVKQMRIGDHKVPIDQIPNSVVPIMKTQLNEKGEVGQNLMKGIKTMYREFKELYPQDPIANDGSKFFLLVLGMASTSEIDLLGRSVVWTNAFDYVYRGMIDQLLTLWRKELETSEEFVSDFSLFCDQKFFNVDLVPRWWEGLGFDDEDQFIRVYRNVYSVNEVNKEQNFIVDARRHFEEDTLPHKQGKDDEDAIVANIFKKLAEGAAKTLTDKDYTLDVSKTFTSSLSGISHILRNGKTIVEILQPLAEKLTATIYEMVTGDAYVSADDRLVVDEITPLLEEMRKYEDIVDMSQRLNRDPVLVEEIEKIKKNFEDKENLLIKLKAPPRYMVPFTVAKKVVDGWYLLAQDVRARGGVRPEPLWIYLTGPAWAGKTTFQHTLMEDVWNLLAKRKKMTDIKVSGPFDRSRVYDRRKETEYWDGYGGQFFTLIDDLFQETDETKRAQTALELIWMVNSAQYQLHMSKIEDKGHVNFSSRCLITSTNDSMLPIDVGLTSMDALYRRRGMVIHLRAAEDRKECSKNDPEFRNGWHIDLYNSFGEIVQEGVDYKSIVAMAVRIIESNSEKSTIPLCEMDDINIDDHEEILNGLLKSNNAAYRKIGNGKSVEAEMRKTGNEPSSNFPSRSQQRGRLAQQVRNYEKNRARFAKKQGANFSSQREETLEEIAEELSGSMYHGDEASLDEAYAKGIEDDPNFNKDKHMIWYKGLPYYTKVQKAQQLIERLRLRIAHAAVSVKEMTLEAWDKVLMSVTVGFGITAFVKLARRGLVRFVERAALRIKEMIKEYWLPVLLGVAGVAAVLGSIYGVVQLVEYFKKEEEPVVERQYFNPSQDDKQREAQQKREEAKVQRMEEREARKLAVAEHRARHRGVAYKQVRITDKLTMEAIETNLYHTAVYSVDSHEYIGQIFFVAGRVAITAQHVASWMQEHQNGYTVLSQGNGGLHSTDIKVPNSAVKFARIPCTEATMLLFPKWVKSHRNRLGHFMTDRETENEQNHLQSEIVLMSRFVNAKVDTKTTSYCELVVADPYKEEMNNIYWVAPSFQTNDGESGGIWFTSNTKVPHRLMGVHSGASKVNAFASAITQDDLIHTAKSNGWLSEIHSEIHVVEEPEFIAHDVEQFADNINMLGVVKQGASLPSKNNIVPSVLSKGLKREGLFPTNIPTQVRQFKPLSLNRTLINKGWLEREYTTDDNEVSPLKKGQLKMNVASVLCPSTLLNEVASGLAGMMPKPQAIKIMHPASVVHGHAALGVDGIDMTSSAGWPWNLKSETKNRKIIFKTCFEEWNPDFLKSLHEIFAVNAGPGYYMPTYTDSLKIERDDIASVLSGKTRIFFAGELGFLIYGLCIGGDILNFWKKNCTGPVCPGLNPHSRAWGELWIRLCKHPNFIATDAKNWDLGQQAQVIEALITFMLKWIDKIEIINLAKDFVPEGADFATLLEKAIRGCSVSRHIVNNIMYEMFKSWMSGNWFTSTGNCFINAICWRVVFIYLARQAGVSFSEPMLQAYARFIEDCFYGDDCILSVSNYIAPWFNQMTCAAAWKQLFGITLTDSGKGTIESPFTKKELVTFLSRHFNMRDGHCWAPLKKEIIMDCLHWCTDSGRNPSISSQNITGALIEAVHHGREFYNYLYELLQRAAKDVCKFEPLDYDAMALTIRNRS